MEDNNHLKDSEDFVRVLDYENLLDDCWKNDAHLSQYIFFKSTILYDHKIRTFGGGLNVDQSFQKVCEKS